MATNFKKIIDSGWTNFKRNSYLSFAATSIMALVLILFLGLLSLQFLSSQIVATLQEKIDISAYLKTDATEEQALKIKSDLSILPEVANVTYISQEQALADFKARHAQDELIQESLEQLDSNPLAASLNIKTKDPSQYAAIAQFLENSTLRSVIDKINFYENRGVIERIEGISRGVRSWGLIVTLVLALIAVLVTFNTVRLTIFNQRQEIEIMRLVGASNWHIRGPFVVEGALYGIIAGLAVLIIFYPMVYLASPRVQSFIPSMNLANYFSNFFGQMAVLVLGSGIALGVVSSIIAVRRYLKI